MLRKRYQFIYLFIYLFGIHFQNSGTHPKVQGVSNTKQSYKVIKRYKDIYKVEKLGAYINETPSLQYTVYTLHIYNYIVKVLL